MSAVHGFERIRQDGERFFRAILSLFVSELVYFTNVLFGSKGLVYAVRIQWNVQSAAECVACGTGRKFFKWKPVLSGRNGRCGRGIRKHSQTLAFPFDVVDEHSVCHGVLPHSQTLLDEHWGESVLLVTSIWFSCRFAIFLFSISCTVTSVISKKPCNTTRSLSTISMQIHWLTFQPRHTRQPLATCSNVRVSPTRLRSHAPTKRFVSFSRLRKSPCPRT